MAEKATKITRVEIEGLWGRYDLVWNLRPDVNILAGVNGSGKSTILNCVAETITAGKINSPYQNTIENLKIDFDNGDSFGYGFDDSPTLGWFLFEHGPKGFIFNLIDTFDPRLVEVARTKEGIQTQLDWLIDYLQKAYLDYQLTVNKRVLFLLKEKGDNAGEKALSVMLLKERFHDIIDDLFVGTEKKINRDKNELTFVSGGKQIVTNQLSAGEKQLLIILMTVLVQDNKPSILLLDEPEISLHIDWQKKLIGYIRELNPNCQVILATHSPAIIMEGWADCVFEVRDLITLNINIVLP